MTNNNTHPTTAKDLLQHYPGMADVFLLANVFETANATHVRITPEMPIALRESDTRDKIYSDTGIFLPTIREIGNPDQMQRDKLSSNMDWDKVYTLAAGPLLWLKDPEGETRIHLLQNTPSKPVFPEHHNTPSGLVSSRDPFSSFFNVANSQSSVIRVSGSNIHGYNFAMPQELAGTISDEFRDSVIAKRSDQEANILTQLNLPAEGSTIEWTTLETQLLENEGAKPVIIEMPHGQKFTLNGAHCLVDDTVKSTNVHFPISAEIPHKFEDLTNLDTQGVGNPNDPEFRNTGFYTLEEAKALDTTPAPRDYLQNLDNTPSI